ncbi:hypothetical protein AALP_AA2G211200 [Arabis alpina]|uniref:Uncharacterized protein n=1 Tax=Arabis alpina TaxID=50452 RepID=A0A087HJ01_ARAAL|nr:hypothetical protein AALP_AA2G211200 [Arabis alpina]
MQSATSILHSGGTFTAPAALIGAGNDVESTMTAMSINGMIFIFWISRRFQL